MRKERHISALIKLLKDIRKEPSPAVVGFIYSTALVHMFDIAFHDEIDPSFHIKHQQFGKKEGISKLKGIIHEFKEKDELFELWRGMENERNNLCYGNPSQKDIESYVNKFFEIKIMLEKISRIKFEPEELEKSLPKNE